MMGMSPSFGPILSEYASRPKMKPSYETFSCSHVHSIVTQTAMKTHALRTPRCRSA